MFPTGFIHYDMAYYSANARELFDGGHFSLLYSNPGSFDYSSPRIFFQPLIVILGLLDAIPGADPGVVFAIVGVLGAVVCARIAIALYDRFAGAGAAGRSAGLVAFIWGGGALVAAGALFILFHSGARPRELFRYDTSWWFPNLGRNLVFPTEAIYHALFLGTMVLLYDRRFRMATFVMALLAISHPFTGIELLGVVTTWALLEIAILRSAIVPKWFLAACVALTLAHVAYYLVFLSTSPEQREVQRQWSVAWTVSLWTLLFGQLLVGGLALWRMRTRERAAQVLREWPNRLLVVWFVVALLFAKQELFLPAMQPIHFTRGYQWIPLFLLGLPVLLAIFARIRAMRSPVLRTAAILGVLGILVFDNAVWFAVQAAEQTGLKRLDGRKGPPFPTGVGLTKDQIGLFHWMSEPPNRGFVVVSDDPWVGYLATVYTPLRSWRAHDLTTPYTVERQREIERFFYMGEVVDRWRGMPLLLVFRRGDTWRERVAAFGGEVPNPSFENGSYVVVRRTRSAYGSVSLPVRR